MSVAVPEHDLRDLHTRRRVLAEAERVEHLVDEEGPDVVRAPPPLQLAEPGTETHDTAPGRRIGQHAGSLAGALVVGVVEEDAAPHVGPYVDARRVQLRPEELPLRVAKLR